jgi:hypothetical protein
MKCILSESKSFYFAFRFKLHLAASTTLSSYPLRIRSSSQNLIWIKFDSVNYSIEKADSTFLGTLGNSINDGNWHLIELYVYMDDTLGIVQCKINGSMILDLNNLSLYDQNISELNFYIGSNYYIYIDNVIVDDSEWIGNTHIAGLKPNADGSLNEWTPSIAKVNKSTDTYSAFSGSDVYRIGDESLSTGWDSLATSQTNGWIIVQLSNSFIVTRLRLYPHNPTEIPTNISISGSNDGSNWTLITSGINTENLSSQWQEFDFTNTISYSYYKLNWDSVFGGGAYSSLKELELCGVYNFACVDEVPANETDYVKTTSSDKIDLYGLENLPADAASVKSITVSNRLIKEGEPDPENMNNAIRTNGTDYFGSDEQVQTSYYTHSTVWSINPDTGLPFTVDEINALEAGVKSKA